MPSSKIRVLPAAFLPGVLLSLALFAGVIGSATPASSYGNDDGTSNTGTVIGTPVPLA